MKDASRGFVLVIVLWVLAMLTLVSVGLGHRMMLDMRAAAYTLDHVQALMMARAAAQRGIVVLRNKAVTDLADALHPDITFYGQEWAQPFDLFAEKLVEPPEGTETDICTFTIRDEEARFNLNTVSFDVLEAIEPLDRSVVRRIRARRTEGEEEGRGPAPFHAVEELRYMRGVNDKEWFGKDDEPGICDLFTTVGSGRINVNTAPRVVLESLPKIEASAVDAVLAYREGPDGELGTADDLGFWDWNDLMDQTGIQGESLGILRRYGDLNSACFTVTGIATRRNGQVRAAVSATVMVVGGEANLLDWREEPLGP